MDMNSEGVEEWEDAEAGHAEGLGAHWQLQAKWARQLVFHPGFDIASVIDKHRLVTLQKLLCVVRSVISSASNSKDRVSVTHQGVEEGFSGS